MFSLWQHRAHYILVWSDRHQTRQINKIYGILVIRIKKNSKVGKGTGNMGERWSAISDGMAKDADAGLKGTEQRSHPGALRGTSRR